MEIFHSIGSETLSFETIYEILQQGYKLKLSDEARTRVQKCRDYHDTTIKTQTKPIYGIPTGFGLSLRPI